MLTSELYIAIPGHPKTKGSMKCIGQVGNRQHVLIEDHRTAKPWLDALTLWCRKLKKHGVAAKGQPIGVEAAFTIKRPDSHFRTTQGKPNGLLKPAYVDAVPVGHNTGDVDKLLRTVLDALQKAAVMPDDCAVLDVTSRKRYVQIPPEPADDFLPYPGVVIRLYPIEDPS